MGFREYTETSRALPVTCNGSNEQTEHRILSVVRRNSNVLDLQRIVVLRLQVNRCRLGLLGETRHGRLYEENAMGFATKEGRA